MMQMTMVHKVWKVKLRIPYTLQPTHNILFRLNGIWYIKNLEDWNTKQPSESQDWLYLCKLIINQRNSTNCPNQLVEFMDSSDRHHSVLWWIQDKKLLIRFHDLL